MKIGSALATLALLTLTPSAPASAGAKDDKLPKCSGSKKRPANLYGTVLPTVPPRAGISPAAVPAAQVAPPTNLFPAPSDTPSGPSAATSDATKVPAISANLPGTDRHAALPISYASC